MQRSEQIKLRRLGQAAADAEIDYWEEYLSRDDPREIEQELHDLRAIAEQADAELEARIAQSLPHWGVWTELAAARQVYLSHRESEQSRSRYQAARDRAIKSERRAA